MKRRSVALFGSCLLMAAGAAARTKPTAWMAPSAEQVNSVYPDVEALYLDLHRNPELSLHEQKAAAKLVERMQALGYEVTPGVGGAGHWKHSAAKTGLRLDCGGNQMYIAGQPGKQNGDSR